MYLSLQRAHLCICATSRHICGRGIAVARCAKICATCLAQIFFMKREFACDFVCAHAKLCASANTFMKPPQGFQHVPQHLNITVINTTTCLESDKKSTLTNDWCKKKMKEALSVLNADIINNSPWTGDNGLLFFANIEHYQYNMTISIKLILVNWKCLWNCIYKSIISRIYFVHTLKYSEHNTTVSHWPYDFIITTSTCTVVEIIVL